MKPYRLSITPLLTSPIRLPPMSFFGEEDTISHLIVEWIKTTILLAVYFLPGYIALHRQGSNFLPISLMNVFLGWTGIGWIVCLIWSVSDDVQQKSGPYVGY